MKSQVFIASFWKDAEWLRHNLITLKKFSEGFLPPVIGCTNQDYALMRKIADESFTDTIVVGDDRGPGFMPAQSRMCRCDEYCPDADLIFLLGSDCLAVERFTPDPYLHEGKPVMLYNTWDHLAKYAPNALPWKKGTQRILGFEPAGEFMRRIPTTHPRELYAPMREHVERLHGMPFDRYMIEGNKVDGCTSETNILGAYAWEFMHDIYHWVCLDDCYDTEMPKWKNPICQFWSHAANGLDSPCDRDYAYSYGSTLGKTPRQVFGDVMG